MGTISNKQAICLLSMSLLGSALVLNSAIKAGVYSWAPILIGGLLALPMYLIYAYITKHYQDKSILGIFTAILGKGLGTVLCFVFSLFALLVASILLREFSEFLTMVSLIKTDILFIVLGAGLLSLFLACKGVETMARFCSIVIPLIFAIIVITGIFSIKDMDIRHLLYSDPASMEKVFDSSLMFLCFPLLEAAFFLGVFGKLNNPKKSYKVYVVSLIIAVAILAFSTLRNTLLLGTPTQNLTNYPSYSAVSIGSLGDFLERTEVTVAAIFLLCGIVKIAASVFVSMDCVLCALPKLKTRIATWGIGGIFLIVAGFVISNVSAMMEMEQTIIYISLGFLALIPLILFLTALAKRDKEKFIRTES